MVKGLDIFRRHFGGYSNQYVLIGGTACDLAMEAAGLEFRATKDLDIVLCVEALEKNFVKRFWDFVRAGGYRVQEKSTGKKQFYRFKEPGNEGFPFMLELFAKKPDVLSIADGSRLTPIPLDEEVSSLSAILLDDGYYEFILSGRREIDETPIVRSEHLICLKAKAWLDLKGRRERGEKIDSNSIKKHKNDVFRLFQIIDPEFQCKASKAISDDMEAFIKGMASENVDLKALGIRSRSLDSILADLGKIYCGG